MKYALVSQKYIDGEDINNWHLFEAKADTDIQYIDIAKESICGKSVKNLRVIVTEKPFFYYLLKERGIVIVKDVNVAGSYYSNIENTVYYSDDENIIRVLAAILGKDVCGTCVSHLYQDEDIE